MAFGIPRLVRKDTAPFTFTFPGKTITLHTRPLTLETREVFNDAFRERPETKATDKYDERVTTRAENLEKLARLCVTSWDGVDAECTPDNVLALLREIDDAGYREEITAYTLWAQNPLNFRAPVADPVASGKG